jgi:hypothetical protein
MLTPAGRLTVSTLSFAVLMATLGACARGPAPVAWEGAPIAAGDRTMIRFENEARTYVDVYLIGETRQWWLGRVAPGANTTLRIKDEALEVTSGYVRLAVLPDGPLTVQAARDPRATLTIAQPGASLLSQRWTFRQSQLTAPEIFGAPVSVSRR